MGIFSLSNMSSLFDKQDQINPNPPYVEFPLHLLPTMAPETKAD